MTPSSRQQVGAEYHPEGHVDDDAPVSGVRLGPVGWARWFWRQLTSMRTALFLLLLLALAAIPGSLFPQRSSDPNGVLQYQQQHPDTFDLLNRLQVFDTYSSFWFSAIYLLLFVSLIGCIIPRIWHHAKALRAAPPRTPFRLQRMAGYRTAHAPGAGAEAAVEEARRMLRRSGYRVAVYDGGASVSAERGYLRETGNLVFHIALVGILVAVFVGGGYGWTAQRVVVEGQTYVNTSVNLDSFNGGRFVDSESMPSYAITLDKLAVSYETKNVDALGLPLDYDASVTVRERDGEAKREHLKVNEPLSVDGTSVYLLGNGYAPVLTFRAPDGTVVFDGPTPFLPQDADLTSNGVIKVPDGLAKQLGVIGIFMPTAPASTQVMQVSTFPDLRNPRLSLTLFTGDLGLDNGVPVSVYSLDTDKLVKLAGPDAPNPALNLTIGQTVELPDGLGTVTFDGVKRFASLDVHYDPAQLWLLTFAVLAVLGLLTSLFVARRRVWVKAVTDASGAVTLEYAGLARGEDPRLASVVAELAERHAAALAAAER